MQGVLESQLLDAEQRARLDELQDGARETRELAQELLRHDWLTAYQVNQIVQGHGPELVLGPFVLLERIGEGGMGQVFKARQKMLNRTVALKVIRKECVDNPKVIQRFKREIRAAGQLNHPHIVRAYDADQVNGTYYIAMEYIDGVDMARYVRDNGPLPVDQACEYIRQAALGLQHAFERGMVHRDIKPANLLVTKAIASDRRRSSGMIQRPLNLPPAPAPGEKGKSKADVQRSSSLIPRAELAEHYPWGIVKILDMGLARCTDPITGQTSTHLTQLGSVMGTPEYIAPEQARDSHTSDIRADLYSLGCTLYYLLTGLPPFPYGTLTEKLLQHQLDAPPPVGQTRRERLTAWREAHPESPRIPGDMHVPKPIEDVLQRLLSKRPEGRYQTPVELANELQGILKQLASGALAAKAEPAAGGAASPTAPKSKVAAEADTTEEISPAPEKAVTLQPPQRAGTMVALALASLGGLAAMIVVTVIAVVIHRVNRSDAGTVDADPPAKNKFADDPIWKQAVCRALQKRITWDEARLELLRHRAAAANGQARQIDELLWRLPTPFDYLERGKFAPVLPADLPNEVVGLYGFAKAGTVKPVAAVAVSPNGRWLAATEDNGMRLFDLLGPLLPMRPAAHNGRVHHVAFSADGRRLASASEDGTVRIWDTLNRTRLATFDLHKRPVTRVAFNHDGSLIASAGRDGKIRLWDPQTGGESRNLDSGIGYPTALAFSPSGQHLFWAGDSNQIYWTTAKADAAARGSLDAKFPSIRLLAHQPNGNLVIASGIQGALRVCAWDGKTLVERTTIRAHAQPHQVHHIVFAPNGKSFAAVGSDPTVTIWDAQTLKPTRSFNALRTPGHSGVYSPDGRHLAIGAGQNQVLIVRLASFDIDALKAALD
ncbi:MAG: serine/threonine protein kinase [Planctomycetes bacterium]|nr:serine/threonine protein kinase [Planctomycetota bacterium]